MVLGPSSLPEERPKKPCQHQHRRPPARPTQAAICLWRAGSHPAGEGNWTAWLALVLGLLLGNYCAQGVLLESCTRPGNRTQDWETKFQLGLMGLQSSKLAVRLKTGPPWGYS